MFHHWTNRRKASLFVHIGIVLVPSIFATASAGALWFSLFHDWWIAVPIVIAFDVTALLGLILYIAKIESPFQVLRHLLPFVSVVPLGVELYQILRVHNGIGLSAAVAFIVTTLMTLIAWRCYVTIERLFVSPEVAARQVMQEQVRSLTTMLITAADMQSSIRLAVQDWSERADIRVSVLTPALTGDVTGDRGTGTPSPYREGYVYLVQAAELYKIGFAADPLKRLREIQGVSSVPLSLIHTIETTNMLRLEQMLHQLFEQCRVRGEWFRLTANDVAAIRMIDSSTDAEVTASTVEHNRQLPQITDSQPVTPITTQAVKAYAEAQKVSERTVWRQLKTGKLAVGDILGEVS